MAAYHPDIEGKAERMNAHNVAPWPVAIGGDGVAVWWDFRLADGLALKVFTAPYGSMDGYLVYCVFVCHFYRATQLC